MAQNVVVAIDLAPSIQFGTLCFAALAWREHDASWER